MRLYIPATMELLAAYRDGAAIPEDVERIAATDDSEEAEYLALMTAADHSAQQGSRRRVVLVADRPIEYGAIDWSELVAIHADAAPFTDPDDEPGWYGVQEIGAILGVD
ncbi:MAG: DUF6912 family protein [Marmoricola sp.]